MTSSSTPGRDAVRVARTASRANAFTGSRVDEADAYHVVTEETSFLSNGIKCGATLFTPEGVSRPPVVVMGHGFGATRVMGLQLYAQRFAERGLAVLTFDYRTWNDSDGSPRQYINPRWQNEDFDAAITYARSLPQVDCRRIALWGTAFSGGHVLATAARQDGITAVVSQGPFVDGRLTALRLPFVHQLRALAHGIYDRVSAKAIGHRHLVRIAGEYGRGKGKFALINTQDGFDGEARLLGVSDPSEYEQMNFCPADIALTMPGYRPLQGVRDITCPVLLIGVEKDSYFWPTGAHIAARRMRDATYIGYQIDHYDSYFGSVFERIVVQMTDFLEAHLAS